MNTQKISQSDLQDANVNLKLKLASMWTSVMFLIVYIVYFHLFMPGSLKDILAGKVFLFDITQIFLLAALATVIFPALMIFLSVALPAKINRWANIIIAAIKIPMLVLNLAGEAWMHMMVGTAIEIFLLCLVIFYAWKWPRVEA